RPTSARPPWPGTGSSAAATVASARCRNIWPARMPARNSNRRRRRSRNSRRSIPSRCPSERRIERRGRRAERGDVGMTASPSRVRAFLGLPALDDPVAMTQPRAIPWRAAPAAFGVALAVLTAIGIAVQEVWNGRDNWQVNSPAIAGLTAILLLAPSSPTQPRARHAITSAIVGLAIIGAAYLVAIARQDAGTGYG